MKALGFGEWKLREQDEVQGCWRRAELAQTLAYCVPLRVRGMDASWGRN
ncbi:MAG TPA: hypothetical protein VGR28_11820 [Candidatus Thermoplasmatota archaeon]|jgi:hypothetical protein|nr:hypothetical protein [Candidatus Thermoplasmatota archaeon]